jgi:hypothetical protein
MIRVGISVIAFVLVVVFFAVIVADLVVHFTRDKWTSEQVRVLAVLGDCETGQLYLVESLNLNDARYTWCGQLLAPDEALELPKVISVRVFQP